MLCVRLAAVMVAVVLAVSGPRPCQGQEESQGKIDWGQIITSVINFLKNRLWANSSVEFMGKSCNYNQRPFIYRWQLHYRGTFSCPTWTGITGNYETVSHLSVKGKTIEDFLNKIRAAGLVTDAQVNAWLQSQG